MTPEELEIFKMRMKLLATETVLEFITDVQALRMKLSSVGEAASTLAAFRAKLDAAKAEYASIALSGEDPAMSDLKCAEFQEAFEQVSSAFLNRLAGRK